MNLEPEGRITQPRRKIFISTSAAFVSNLVIALLGTLSLRVMTVNLGPNGYGVFVTALTFVTSTMLLTDLGVNSLTGREIARHPESARDVLGTNVGLRIALSVLLIPTVWIVGSVAYASHAQQHDLTLGILIVALAIPFDAIRAVSLGYFVSRIENHRTATVNLIMQVCFVGFTITTIEMNGGVLGCFWSYLAATIISSSVAFGFTTSRVRFRPIVSLARWRDVVRKSFSIGIIQITNTVYLKLDTIILSLFLTSRSVALYGVATAIVAFFLVIPNMYMTSLVPIMAVAKLDEMPGILQRAISNMSAIGSLVAAGCICTGSGVVHLLAGTKFAGSATALSILSLSVILTAVSSVFGYALFAQDRHHRMVIVSVIVLFFNGGLNALVIPRYGVNGSAWAMIASEFIVLVGSYVIFKMKLSIRVDVARPLIRPIIAGTVTCLVVRELWQPAEIRVVALAAVIVSVAVLYVTVLALIGGIQRQAVVSLVRAGRQRLRSKVP